MTSDFPGDPFVPRRRATREVRIGDVAVGATNPIRIQSMTTTNTQDTHSTVDQIEVLANAGCEIVRVTVPSIRDAENLREIRSELGRRRVRVPLVADIHFTPNAALIAAEWVDKVRINPGNFADKKRFEVREYTEVQYAEELERVAERFQPLVRRCQKLGRALRIGTNHGSLSDRILNRYGDTPRGMVESALEFLEVCAGEGFADVVFSMKASNPQVAIQAYRLLATRLAERSPGAPGYPFHLGVTEAGDGDEGRIKSAIGIGTLLEDGLGDTIRVSLSEDPVRELPVARALARRYEKRWSGGALGAASIQPGAPFTQDPYSHARRPTRPVRTGSVRAGGNQPVRVELALGSPPADAPEAARELAEALKRLGELRCEGLRVDAQDRSELARAWAFHHELRRWKVGAPLAVRLRADAVEQARGLGDRWILGVTSESKTRPLADAAGEAQKAGVGVEWNLCARPEELLAALDLALEASRAARLDSLLFSTQSERPVHAARLLAAGLCARGRAESPIVLLHQPAEPVRETPLIEAAVDIGAPLCDGIGDLVALPAGGDPARALERVYRILQGARLRTSWTEFISCPSCGRTQFDLEETTVRIKARTQHLKGVKIAIMGCIVNGPGEMADADFGYVGSGPGRVNLYVGMQLVERHLPAEEADERLVELIRKHGRWLDP
jgi:(E)-4-hydroxy-3-methylbut-2-enyl-diphosphate synthase